MSMGGPYRMYCIARQVCLWYLYIIWHRNYCTLTSVFVFYPLFSFATEKRSNCYKPIMAFIALKVATICSFSIRSGIHFISFSLTLWEDISSLPSCGSILDAWIGWTKVIITQSFHPVVLRLLPTVVYPTMYHESIVMYKSNKNGSVITQVERWLVGSASLAFVIVLDKSYVTLIASICCVTSFSRLVERKYGYGSYFLV